MPFLNPSLDVLLVQSCVRLVLETDKHSQDLPLSGQKTRGEAVLPQ